MATAFESLVDGNSYAFFMFFVSCIYFLKIFINLMILFFLICCIFQGKFTARELLVTKTPLCNGNDIEGTREQIRNYFHRTFSLYEMLFELLANDDTFYEQPDRLRHPLIFYWGHTVSTCDCSCSSSFDCFSF